MPFDVAKIRADFPVLATQVYDKPLVYLDNAASAQKPLQVTERMQSFSTYEYANVHRGLHYLSNTATNAFEAARGQVAAFLNAAAISKSFSPAVQPMPLIWWPMAILSRASVKATKLSCPSWNTIQILCRGISCANAMAPF